MVILGIIFKKNISILHSFSTTVPNFTLLRPRNFRKKGSKDFASRINDIIDNVSLSHTQKEVN